MTNNNNVLMRSSSSSSRGGGAAAGASRIIIVNNNNNNTITKKSSSSFSSSFSSSSSSSSSSSLSSNNPLLLFLILLFIQQQLLCKTAVAALDATDKGAYLYGMSSQPVIEELYYLKDHTTTKKATTTLTKKKTTTTTTTTLILNPPLLDNTKASHPCIVEFYSPQCPACRNFKKTYIELATKITTTTTSDNNNKNNNNNNMKNKIHFYAVSCAAHYSICKKHNIRHYPTLKSFNIGQSSESMGNTIKATGRFGGLSYTVNDIMKSLEEEEDEETSSSSSKMETTSHEYQVEHYKNIMIDSTLSFLYALQYEIYYNTNNDNDNDVVVSKSSSSSSSSLLLLHHGKNGSTVNVDQIDFKAEPEKEEEGKEEGENNKNSKRRRRARARARAATETTRQQQRQRRQRRRQILSEEERDTFINWMELIHMYIPSSWYIMRNITTVILNHVDEATLGYENLMVLLQPIIMHNMTKNTLSYSSSSPLSSSSWMTLLSSSSSSSLLLDWENVHWTHECSSSSSSARSNNSSNSSSRNRDAYECGLWKLLHVISIGTTSRRKREDVYKWQQKQLNLIIDGQKKQTKQQQQQQKKQQMQQQMTKEKRNRSFVTAVLASNTIQRYIQTFFNKQCGYDYGDDDDDDDDDDECHYESSATTTTAQHFLDLYKKCELKSCQRLHNYNNADSGGGGGGGLLNGFYYHDTWKEFGLWLWEIHNSINDEKRKHITTTRTKAMRRRRRSTGEEEEEKEKENEEIKVHKDNESVTNNNNNNNTHNDIDDDDDDDDTNSSWDIWPSTKACPRCRKKSSNNSKKNNNKNVISSPNTGVEWNRNYVYEFLIQEYWPWTEYHAVREEYLMFRKRLQRLHKPMKRQHNTKLGIFGIICTILICILLERIRLYYYKKQSSGRHKKNEDMIPFFME